MSRSLTPTMVSASTASVVRFVVMAKLDFVSGVIRANTTSHTLLTPVSSESYGGIGTFGGINDVKEDLQLGANGISLLLSGVDLALVSTALGENYQGRSATIMVGLCNEGWNLVDEPTTVFKGRMDTMSIATGETDARINLTCENRMASWDRPRNLRYNAETQKLFYPADRGLEFVEQAASKEIFWGRAAGVTN